MSRTTKNGEASIAARVRKTRAWAAPQVERTGQALQDNVAPKVAALLTSAAQRLEPGQRRRRRWRELALVSMLTAAASAVAALARSRRKPGGTAAQDGQATAQDGQAAAQDGQAADDVPPATKGSGVSA